MCAPYPGEFVATDHAGTRPLAFPKPACACLPFLFATVLRAKKPKDPPMNWSPIRFPGANCPLLVLLVPLVSISPVVAVNTASAQSLHERIDAAIEARPPVAGLCTDSEFIRR